MVRQFRVGGSHQFSGLLPSMDETLGMIPFCFLKLWIVKENTKNTFYS